jgi:hypothetical protein
MSSRYSAEEKAEILRRTRELLEQLNEQRAAAEAKPEPEPEPEPWRSRTDILLDPMSRSSAPMNRWRAEQEQFQREREAYAQQEQRKMDERKAQSDAEWNVWFDAKLATALTTKGHDLFDAFVGIIVELRRERRAEIKKAIDELRAELDMQREHAAKFGEVIDLPSPLIRKVKDNAA